MQAHLTSRLRFISVIFVLLGIIFVVRLHYLQVQNGAKFLKEANNQYVATVSNQFDRGNIYFRSQNNKLVTGATINSGFVVSITPKLVSDKEKTYAAISAITPLDHKSFIEKAKRINDPYEEILRRVSDKDAESIRALKLPGVQLFRETWRYYPGGQLAAHVLGFVGFAPDGEDLIGRYGIESYYNDVLTRHEDNLYVNFFAEIFSNIRSTVFERSKEEEADIVLTVEPTVQAYLEKELEDVMSDWSSDLVGGIIMDPKTGAIFAMASNPTYDLNEYGKVKDGSVFPNPSIQDVYEMGSTMKPLTMAAGLDAGVITANSTYNDTGSITMNNKTFWNYDRRARGPGTSMQEVLNQSLNTGVSHVVGKLGNQRFADYFRNKFHLGEETGIDLPGERQGLMNNLNSNRDIEFAQASFGQGIAVTPINMITALSIMANDGTSVTPHVVEEIRYEGGRIKKSTPNPVEQVISRAASEEVTRMLVTVVDKALLGGKVKIPEYSVAAKTGTAQMARPREEGGGYYEDKYIHTFFGYFPAYEPRFMVFLYTKNPKNVEFASHTLTHPFNRITKFLLNYYGIPPDRGTTVTRQH